MYGMYGKICFIYVHNENFRNREGIFDEFWQKKRLNYELRSNKNMVKIFYDLCIQREMFFMNFENIVKPFHELFDEC